MRFTFTSDFRVLIGVVLSLCFLGSSFALPVRHFVHDESYRRGPRYARINHMDHSGYFPSHNPYGSSPSDNVESVFDLSAKAIIYSAAARRIARQFMIHNQEMMSDPGRTPLYKQSYPGLYVKGDLKEFAYEPTNPVSHAYSHHGKEGHLFLNELGHQNIMETMLQYI